MILYLLAARNRFRNILSIVGKSCKFDVTFTYLQPLFYVQSYCMNNLQVLVELCGDLVEKSFVGIVIQY